MHALSRQSKVAPPPHGPRLRRAVAAGLLPFLLTAASLHAQGAIDPNVAPRAAALEREGERHMAIDLALECGGAGRHVGVDCALRVE